jgi:hypothetical protein
MYFVSYKNQITVMDIFCRSGGAPLSPVSELGDTFCRSDTGYSIKVQKWWRDFKVDYLIFILLVL